LLIGDPALMIDEAKYRKFDLAETWRAFTGFGFVFAMWMANKEKLEIARTIDFAAARDEGLAHIAEIISNYEAEISLSKKDFRRYLSENISYSIDENMREGLRLYFELAHKHNLTPANKPLLFTLDY
jgi:chorismate dehydratase